VEVGVFSLIASGELDFGSRGNGVGVAANNLDVGASWVELSIVILGVVKCKDVVLQDVFSIRKLVGQLEREGRSGLGDEIGAPNTGDGSGFDTADLLDLNELELSCLGVGAATGATSEVVHYGSVVVLRAGASVASGPEGGAIPVEDDGGTRLGFGNELTWTNDLVAGNVGTFDVIDRSIAATVGPEGSRLIIGVERVGALEDFAVNGDLFDESVRIDSRELSCDEKESGLGEHFLVS